MCQYRKDFCKTLFCNTKILFYKFNDFYDFSKLEILSILEKECKQKEDTEREKEKQDTFSEVSKNLLADRQTAIYLHDLTCFEVCRWIGVF